ncbi:MAG: FAD-dependent oxidoreductase [Deltaproteobacteria bacterium]|nr:FAD-dependent oxidoreductase [Deltaproteobacteria bacterium]
MKKIAVIAGAGPAGLTAAHEFCSRTDITPLVLEAGPGLGGAARTVQHRGNRMDVGGHRFFTSSPRVLDFWTRFLPLEGACGRPGPDPEREDRVMLVRDRKSSVVFKGCYLTYPLTPEAALVRCLGPAQLAGIAASYAKSRLFPMPEETLEGFLVNRFGRRLYEIFFKDYTQKVWGAGPERILARWGRERIQELSAGLAAKNALRRLAGRPPAAGDVPKTLVERFLYPKYGPGQMWEEVAADVVRMGGRILTGHRVGGLRLERDRVRSVKAEGPEGGVEIEADYFFSTMPVADLVEGIEPRPPALVLETARGLEHRDFISVGVLANPGKGGAGGLPPGMDQQWLYIQDTGYRAARVQIYNNWSPYLVADPGQWLLGVEYFTGPKDDLWAMTDPELARLAVSELSALGLLRASQVEDAVVMRQKNAYPAYFPPYRKFPLVRSFLDAVENLFLVGRSGMHRYNNMDHSMLTAMLAVDAVVREKTDKSLVWAASA